jgi:hypothetical protein
MSRERKELRSIKKFSESINEFCKESYLQEISDGERSEFIICLRYLVEILGDKINNIETRLGKDQNSIELRKKS